MKTAQETVLKSWKFVIQIGKNTSSEYFQMYNVGELTKQTNRKVHGMSTRVIKTTYLETKIEIIVGFSV